MTARRDSGDSGGFREGDSGGIPGGFRGIPGGGIPGIPGGDSEGIPGFRGFRDAHHDSEIASSHQS